MKFMKAVGLLVVFSFIVLGACQYPTENENSGVITFTFGTGATARWTGGAPSSAVQGKLAHEIKLYRGDNYGTLYKTINVGPGVTSHTETGIPLGDLKVTIDSKLNGYPFAQGETTTTVVAGPNRTSAPVNMNRLEHGIVLSENSGSTHTFTVLAQGYSSTTPLTVTVENYAENATGALAVALTGTGSGSFTLSAASIASIAQDSSATFTVTPKTGLAVETYNATVSVTGGNGISASFTVSVTVSDILDVYDTATWNAALAAITSGGNGKSHTINVTGDFSTAGVTTNTFGSVTGLNVTISGNHTITLSGQGSLLRIGANQTVTLKDTHLVGFPTNNTSLVYVTGGTFNMEGGTISDNISSLDGGGVTINVNGGTATFNMTGGTISGNTARDGGGVYGTAYSSSIATLNMSGTATISGNTTGSNGRGGGVFLANVKFNMSGTATISGNTANGTGGGGVFVFSDATFNMTGGTISGNTASNSTNGGGVNVNTQGNFNMEGGTISGNIASGRGGGVFVGGTSATFRLATGTIYGSNGGSNANTAGEGAALYNYVTAQRGTFTGVGGAWESKGDLTSPENNTIKVVNGEFEP